MREVHDGKRDKLMSETLRQTESRVPIVLDLFCGAGGLSLGFEMAGYRIGLGVETWELAASTHNRNFGHSCYVGDIRDISDPREFISQHELSSVEVVIGGPPCQGFSKVGRGKMRNLRNDPTYIHDPRNQYYLEFIRFVKELRPLFFVMENVPDMQFYTDGDGRLLDKALRTLRTLNYEVDWNILAAHHYGVPQTRRRLFIVGNALRLPIRWPARTHEDRSVTVWDAIGDLPIISHGYREDEMVYRPRCELTPYQHMMRDGAGDDLYNHQTRRHNQQDLDAFAWLPEGGKYRDLPAEYKRYRDDIFQDKYWKLKRDSPSWTIEAHIGKDTYRHIYPSQQGEPEPPRTISVREAARLQSFPDRFRFLGAFTKQFYQVGNAVPPLLAKALADMILPDLMRGMSGEIPGTTAPDREDSCLSPLEEQLPLSL